MGEDRNYNFNDYLFSGSLLAGEEMTPDQLTMEGGMRIYRPRLTKRNDRMDKECEESLKKFAEEAKKKIEGWKKEEKRKCKVKI